MEEREVLVTAYYSPLPNQRKYFLGNYEADQNFNGKGVLGADGTPVYPGMIAAPAEFAFGTRVEFVDLGVVGTVHDRGGRIVSGEDGSLRLDLWMGKGEEGLARALNFGAQTLQVRLYVPKNFEVPEENFALSAFDAPATVLKKLPSEKESLLTRTNPRYGDTSTNVTSVQHTLKQMEYFDHPITQYYGPVTRTAVGRFQRDAGLPVNSELADEATREALAAHIDLAGVIEEPELREEILLQGADGKAVRVLQRVLKLLGRYEGEIDGVYDQAMMNTIYAFQKDRELVDSPIDTGAGMVGPQTRRALLTAWRQYRIGKKGGAEAVLAAL